MAGLFQYIKDTRGELRHVSWPTRTQTIVYTVIVAAISVAVALYLGLFDYLFTSTLTRVVNALPSTSAIPAQEESNPFLNITPIEIGSGDETSAETSE